MELRLTRYDFSRAADATLKRFYNSLEIFEKDENLEMDERFFAHLAKKEILLELKLRPDQIDPSEGYRIPNPEWIQEYGSSIVRALLEPCAGVRINSTLVNSVELLKEEFEKFEKNNKIDIQTISTCVDELLEFQSCVILNGSKTTDGKSLDDYVFQSCVILNGSKTKIVNEIDDSLFQSCVILNGSKTISFKDK